MSHQLLLYHGDKREPKNQGLQLVDSAGFPEERRQLRIGALGVYAHYNYDTPCAQSPLFVSPFLGTVYSEFISLCLVSTLFPLLYSFPRQSHGGPR
jgi:hypothetical protein